jgi:hypothetical protein
MHEPIPVSEKISRVFNNDFFKEEHIRRLVSVVIEYLVSLRHRRQRFHQHREDFSEHMGPVSAQCMICTRRIDLLSSQ